MKSFYPFETKLHNKKGILICGFLPSTVALLPSFVFWGGQHTTAPHAFGAVDNGHFSALWLNIRWTHSLPSWLYRMGNTTGKCVANTVKELTLSLQRMKCIWSR